jgi:fatty-acyl-CoA synthase
MHNASSTHATILVAPDFAYRMVAKMLVGTHSLDLNSVRVCISGGERLSWQTLVDFYDAASPFGVKWESLTPMYGLAEATLAVTMSKLGRGPVQGPDGEVSVGRPLKGVESRIRNNRLELRSPWMLAGYQTDAGFTDACDGEGWFETSDLAYEHDDELYISGRADEVIVVAGRNVCAEDVESVARHSSGDALAGCAAFRSPSSDSHFALVLEVTRGMCSESKDLIHRTRTAISESLGVRVRPVVAVKPWTIPRTTSGKVRRAHCRSAIADRSLPASRVLYEAD